MKGSIHFTSPIYRIHSFVRLERGERWGPVNELTVTIEGPLTIPLNVVAKSGQKVPLFEKIRQSASLDSGFNSISQPDHETISPTA